MNLVNLGELRLSALAARFQSLYGRRNADFIDGLLERVGWLALAAGDLQNTIRKKRESNPDEVAADLGRLIGWIFCVANHFPVMPLEEAMRRKCPASGCAYCSSKTCKCGDDRPEPNLAMGTEEQLSWSLIQWQQHLAEVYGPKHIKDGGLPNAMARLFKEIMEIIELKMSVHDMDVTAEELELEFAQEIADVLSWTLGIANLLSIDLNHALMKHAHSCPDCSGAVCTCLRFVARQAKTRRLLSRARRTATPTPDGPVG